MKTAMALLLSTIAVFYVEASPVFSSNDASSEASFFAPLFPEDASAKVGRWYYSESNVHFRDEVRWREIESLAHRYGFKLSSVGDLYDWIQDVFLFDDLGNFVAQAPFPDRDYLSSNIFFGLTMGVANEDSGLLRVTSSEVKSLGLESREMRYTFVEGGGLISGRFSSGDAYALVTQDLLVRVRAFYQLRERVEISDPLLKELIAKDLGVSVQHLFFLPSLTHLDLNLLALPNGKILLHDPSLVPGVLRHLVKTSSSQEQLRYQKMLKFYENGIQRGPQWTLRPSDQSVQAILDEMEKQLSGHFQVVRVAGRFYEYNEHQQIEEDVINFFNGFQGTLNKELHWLLTNQATGLGQLESYWAEVVRRNSDFPLVEVHFPGIYSSGAGLDCSGAVAP